MPAACAKPRPCATPRTLASRRGTPQQQPSLLLMVVTAAGPWEVVDDDLFVSGAGLQEAIALGLPFVARVGNVFGAAPERGNFLCNLMN